MLNLIILLLVIYLSVNYEDNKELNFSALFALFGMMVIVEFGN